MVHLLTKPSHYHLTSCFCFHFVLDAFELITEKDDGTLQFNVPYYYAGVVRDVRRKDTDVFNRNRARRLAQEVASLSTSLPLSYSSTVFLRCDEQRLDVMKVCSAFYSI